MGHGGASDRRLPPLHLPPGLGGKGSRCARRDGGAVPSGAPPNRKCEDTLANVREMFIRRHVARLYTHDAESTIRREVIPLWRGRPTPPTPPRGHTGNPPRAGTGPGLPPPPLAPP